MENIFKQLDYQVSEERKSVNDIEMELLFIKNKNGSIRWVWPAAIKRPLFIKFYNVGSFRSKITVFVIKLIFLFRLQTIVLNKRLFYFSNENGDSNFDVMADWALFTGTVGPNNKAVLMMNKDGISRFIKIALTSNAKRLLKTEQVVLNKLNNARIKRFIFPDIYKATDSTLELSDISFESKRINFLTDMHFNALSELRELTSVQMKLSEIGSWKNVKADLSLLENTDDERMPKGMIRKLIKLADGMDEQAEIELGLSHGDFTSWNMYVQNGLVHLYDWELADPLRPVGFDFFHFIIQQGILVDRKSWKEISLEIENGAFQKLVQSESLKMDDYLKLYLVFNITYYLKLYTEQKVLHEQVYWLFGTWNEALSCLLKDRINQRELVLMDMFDFLLNKPYATIKFQNMYPEKLSEFSDVDMCIEKSIKSQLNHYLKNHPLVAYMNVQNRSFMSTEQVICEDGNILSLDLIWKIKRKELEILDTKELLRKSYTNAFGVKMLNSFDNARYIGLFYSLNDAPVPEKYNYYEEMLKTSSSPLDKQLYPHFIDENYDNQVLFDFVKSQKSNTGMKGLWNKFRYITDMISELLNSHGTVITFSGVDGAGKSTIIENIKFKVEKQLRKRVVVLRHRPSLLPILSAWVKGKEQAEQDTMSSLPRNGKNTAFLSSFIRFAYYYIDYLIGQFIIHVKYVRRGYVVIYDRYYFDFINDSKRSNIVLPKYIAEAGFMFLMKPKFNFFLYADATVILNRKKELDRETIENLTTNYLNHFEKLSERKSSSNYISINNTDLDKTLHTVFSKIAEKAA